MEAENPNNLRREQFKAAFIEQSVALNHGSYYSFCVSIPFRFLAIISSASLKVLDGKQANCNEIANFMEVQLTFTHFNFLTIFEGLCSTICDSRIAS